MDETASNIIEREKALARFDQLRDDFLGLFASVPDEALDFLPEGDSYRLGGLLYHMTSAFRWYSDILDRVLSTVWGEVHLEQGDFERAAGPYNKRAGEPVTPADRHTALSEMEEAHDTIAGRLHALGDDFEREAPVYYPGGDQPYPTSGLAITGWLCDHYLEHIPHVTQLLEGWRGAGQR